MRRTRAAGLIGGLLVVVLGLAACSDRRAGVEFADPGQSASSTAVESDPARSNPDQGDLDKREPGILAEVEAPVPVVPLGEREDVRVVLPLIATIELPAIGELAETGDLAEQRLGGLVSTAISGVDVVAASCAAEGGELVYGDAGDDLFEVDGSGRIVERSSDGLTTLVVEADGSGEFYDEDRANDSLLTVTVASDQSGEYFNQTTQALTTILVNADGSGEFFRESTSFKTTVLIRSDGSGEVFDQRPTGLLTIKAEADGSGEYFFEGDGAKVTVLTRRNGSWQLTDETDERWIQLTVQPDGSGTYALRSLNPLVFNFDTEGNGVSGQRSLYLDVPDTPNFSVAASFPQLGKFGALNPPCATIIRFDAQLLFDFGKSQVREEAASTLDDVVETLNEIDKPIEVNGHTDSRGTDERNVELSLERANAVLAELVERGLDVDTEVNGFGESQPVAENETLGGEDNPSGRALNRRVEIVIRE